MKKLLIASAVAFVSATPAFAAPSDSETFDVTASVPQVCALADIAPLNLGTIPVNTSSGTDALLINGNSAAPNQDVWASCNDSANVTVTALNGALVAADQAANVDGTFTNKINYRVRIQNIGTDVVLATTGVANETTGPQLRSPFHVQARIAATAPLVLNPNTRPLASDQYEDTVTVTLTAS